MNTVKALAPLKALTLLQVSSLTTRKCEEKVNDTWKIEQSQNVDFKHYYSPTSWSLKKLKMNLGWSLKKLKEDT